MANPILLGQYDEKKNLHLKQIDPPTCQQRANKWLEAALWNGLLFLAGLVCGFVLALWR